jgi:acetyl esterase/lipase
MIGRRTTLGLIAAAPFGLAAMAPAAKTFSKSPSTPLERWRSIEAIPIWPDAPPSTTPYAPPVVTENWGPTLIHHIEQPTLRMFRPVKPNGKSVLIIPGGAYLMLSIYGDGIKIADRLTKLGYTAFILTHRMPNEGWSPRADVPLQDARRAMRTIRFNAQKWNIDLKRIAVIGFSAGGHLAASLITDVADIPSGVNDPVERQDAVPFAAGLIYPVISMHDPLAHKLSRAMLLGPNPDKALMDRRSPHLAAGPQTPPCFIAHSIDDDVVKVENAIAITDAFRAANRPVETHLFQSGGHGYGVGKAGTPEALWPDLFAAWLAQLK